jgi:toxin ParE1/3/4
MKVRWSETALAQLDDIFLYIYERNRTAALSVAKRIEKLAALLEEFPLIGHLTDETEVPGPAGRTLSVL